MKIGKIKGPDGQGSRQGPAHETFFQIFPYLFRIRSNGRHQSFKCMKGSGGRRSFLSLKCRTLKSFSARVKFGFMCGETKANNILEMGKEGRSLAPNTFE